MKNAYANVKPLATGFVLVAVGKADGHTDDRRGCNIRIATIPGQPRRGFPTREQAEAFGRELCPTREAFKAMVGGLGDGSYLTNDVSRKLISVRLWAAV